MNAFVTLADLYDAVTDCEAEDFSDTEAEAYAYLVYTHLLGESS
jgi:hypothetical protein